MVAFHLSPLSSLLYCEMNKQEVLNCQDGGVDMKTCKKARTDIIGIF